MKFSLEWGLIEYIAPSNGVSSNTSHPRTGGRTPSLNLLITLPPHSRPAFNSMHLFSRVTYPITTLTQLELWLWHSRSMRKLMRWVGLPTSPIASSGSMGFIQCLWFLPLILTPRHFLLTASTMDFSTSGSCSSLLSYFSSRSQGREENLSVGWRGINHGGEAREGEVDKLL